MSSPHTQRLSRLAALRAWFGLDRGSAAILLSLYSARGQPMTRITLAEQADMSASAIRQRISELRTAMDSEAIDTTLTGYALTEVGVHECCQAFAAMARDLQEMAA